MLELNLLTTCSILPPSQKWRLSIDCYGKRHGKRQECESCELSAYCAEAGDIAPLHSVLLNDSIAHDDIQHADEEPGMEIHGIIAALDAAADNPTGWKMVRECLFNGRSLSQGAKSANLHSRQAGHYHAMKFFRRIEAAFDALNVRYRRSYISEYWTTKPPWLERKAREHDHAQLF
jgi:hypothetical protein